MKQASFASSTVHGGGKRRADRIVCFMPFFYPASYEVKNNRPATKLQPSGRGSQMPRKAENSADVCRAFFGAISAYMLTSPPPQVTSINAAKGGLLL
jgi:hypothetical protein